MLHDQFIRRVAVLGGFHGAAEAEPAVMAVLGALRAAFPDPDAHFVADELEGPVAQLFRSGAYNRELDLDTLRRRVSQVEGVGPGFALEHLQVVCRVLGEGLSEPARARLRARLPPQLAAELDPEPEPAAPPHAHAPERPGVEPGEGTTLASGRPGSRHPLSESQPPGAQAHSVAASENPHGDTKLSSSRGLTQERLHETLAEGKAGPKRTLAGDD